MNRFQAIQRSLDERIMQWTIAHANLITAFSAFVVCIWAIFTGNLWIVGGVIVIGAISYFFGLAAGMGMGIVINVGANIALFVMHRHPHLDAPLIAFVEFCAMAWLGFQHQRQATTTHQQQDKGHTDQVVPWAVANDIRTSLAAIRFLLFPLHGDTKDSAVEQATMELSRLEHIFSQMEREELENKKRKML